MKYAVLIGDGMADYPLGELDGRTPLEVAITPNMDGVARLGQLGLARMIPPGFAPGSDVAILSILGYDPALYYAGRAPMEAARLGIELGEGLVAFRCNLITVEGGRIADYSGGHIGDSEAAELVGFLDQHLGGEDARFYAGVSYRHICVMKGSNLTRVSCVPPHDVIGQPVRANLPRGEGAEQVVGLMERSYRLLCDHDVNRCRIERGERPANMIWLWGQGQAASLPPFEQRFGVGGGVISAVDLVKGIAGLSGLHAIDVPGGTGYYDTDYEAKAEHAIRCLEEDDFVLVHVEAPDEASHNGELDQKLRAIESFDSLVVGAVRRWLSRQPAYRLLVLPDHATPIQLRSHTNDPVPFAWCGEGVEADDAVAFTEQGAAESELQFNDGYKLMEDFIGRKQ